MWTAVPEKALMVTSFVTEGLGVKLSKAQRDETCPAGASGRCLSSAGSGLSVMAAEDGARAGDVGRPQGLLGMNLCPQKIYGGHGAGAVQQGGGA